MMLFAKRRFKFSPDAVYIIVIKKHDGYSPSIGFSHHGKHETGFPAYVKYTLEICMVKLEQSKPSFVPYTLYITQRQCS